MATSSQSSRSAGSPVASPRTRRTESVATQERILDAAEELFIKLGFTATSLRAVASRARVNLAATHYHFGSKEGLVSATVHRRIAHANEMRLEALDQLEARGRAASVEEIMALFFSPLSDDEIRRTVPPLMARLYGEPESISKPLIEREFGTVGRRFVAALAKAIPNAKLDDLRWRFHFVVGAMIHMLNFQHPLAMPQNARARREGMSELMKFAVAGIGQGFPNQRKGKQ
jgi:AcrR family transcriptional regulator